MITNSSYIAVVTSGGTLEEKCSGMENEDNKQRFVSLSKVEVQQVIRVKRLAGLPPPRIQITWAYSLGSEEASLKLLGLAKLERPNSSPISKFWCSKVAIFLRAI